MQAEGTSKTMEDLNKAVAQLATQRGFRKPSFDIKPGSKAGDGYSGLLYRVHIQETESSTSCLCPSKNKAPEDLAVMCKLPMPMSGSIFMAATYSTEGVIYTKILSAIEEITGVTAPWPWPRCYYLAPDETPCLVLSDLKPDGFVMANRRVAMDEGHCRLALQRLAQFHGGGMAMLALRPDETQSVLGSLNNPLEAPEMQAMMQQFPQQVGKALAMLEDRFPVGSEVSNKVQAMLDLTAQEMPRFFNVMAGSQPGVAIIHGDCHVNNVMFKYDEKGAVADCQLIDFQLCRAANTALDVASLLLPCTEKATRDAHWDALLRGYHAELQRVLRRAGCEPDAVYSWQDFEARMREAAFYGLMIAPLLLHAQLADERTTEEIRESLHDAEKVRDGAVFSAISPSDELKRRLGDVVQSLLDLGWL